MIVWFCSVLKSVLTRCLALTHRDHFVTIQDQFLRSGAGPNFAKNADSKWMDAGEQNAIYFYDSIMHYPESAFCDYNRVGTQKTILTNDPQYQVNDTMTFHILEYMAIVLGIKVLTYFFVLDRMSLDNVQRSRQKILSLWNTCTRREHSMFSGEGMARMRFSKLWQDTQTSRFVLSHTHTHIHAHTLTLFRPFQGTERTVPERGYAWVKPGSTLPFLFATNTPAYKLYIRTESGVQITPTTEDCVDHVPLGRICFNSRSF